MACTGLTTQQAPNTFLESISSCSFCGTGLPSQCTAWPLMALGFPEAGCCITVGCSLPRVVRLSGTPLRIILCLLNQSRHGCCAFRETTLTSKVSLRTWPKNNGCVPIPGGFGVLSSPEDPLALGFLVNHTSPLWSSLHAQDTLLTSQMW